MKAENEKRKLEKVLREYGVDGKITSVNKGPVVTLYELEPAPGTRSSKVVNLADDIARSMSAVSCRVAIVPGRSVIGIELPNAKREVVPLMNIITGTNFKEGKWKLPVALGKDIGGEDVVVDITRWPHALVAGTTGSGKSVAINTFIISLLLSQPPEDVKFVMIDPKMLEMSVYADIPHLLTPVITDMSKALSALEWSVREMEDRYAKMAAVGVRNIAGFNELGKDKLPYIVIIIDEVADLMLVAGKEVEAAVQRLAQMARAAGLHLIMATQRPSVDVITGTVKANFPTRIAFQVTSKVDSRTILGEQGAEKLLGMGDMLYMNGGGQMRRVHGAFVSDDGVAKIVSDIKKLGKPKYVNLGWDADEGATNAQPQPDLYEQACLIALIDGLASPAYIQRKLGIGYLRAVGFVERMEREGKVRKDGWGNFVPVVEV